MKPQNDKTNKMTCTHNEDSDQPGHPPSLAKDPNLFSGIAKTDQAGQMPDLSESSLGVHVIW